MLNSASSASSRPRLVSGFRAFSAACQTVIGAAWQRALSIGRKARPSGTRQSAQADAWASVIVICARRHELMSERKILIAAREKAVRQHKAVSGFNARIKTITHELLSIG